MSFRAGRAHPLSALTIALAGIAALWNVLASFVIDHGWRPAGDPALDELLVRDVSSSHFPLVGSYSRFGWNHPGAWFQYLASIPYELSGGGSWTLKLTAALVAGAALVACARAGWKIGERSGIGTHSGAAVASLSWLMYAAGPFGVTLRFSWNVDIAQMLFLALLWWMVAFMLGMPGAGGALVLLGTLLLQLYMGYLPLVGVLALGVLAIKVVRRTQGRGAARLRSAWERRTIRWCVGVAGVLWVPVMIDQIAGLHNLSAIADSLGGEKKSSFTGMSSTLQMLFQQLDGRSLFESHIFPAGWTVPWIALAAFGVWFVVRSEVMRALVWTGVLALVAGAVTIVLSRNELFAYRLLWLSVIGVFWTGLLMWGIVEWVILKRTGFLADPRVRFAAGVVVLAIGLEASAGFTTKDEGQFASRAGDAQVVLEHVRARVPSGRVAVGRSSSGGAHDLLAGLRVAAEHAGESWCDPLDEPWLAGEHRLCGKQRPSSGLYVVGPGDPAPSDSNAAEILDSPKGRVYLMPTPELLGLAEITKASE